jgi:hypothetical protein
MRCLPPAARACGPQRVLVPLLLGLALAGCATRSADVQPLPVSAAEFSAWPCSRIDDELELVQRRAADVAYAVDERGGNNIVALGLGLAVFWPALLAMRADGLEAAELARLKGRYEALREAARGQNCPPASSELPPARAAALPVAGGELLVYEDHADARRAGPALTWPLRLVALRRGEFEYRAEAAAGASVLHDALGNVTRAPQGSLLWPRLLRGELALGQVVGGDLMVSGDPLARARIRGQVVAVGPQTVAGRRFDVAVVELYGDAQRGDQFTRLDGVLVVDRTSGVLLRLDLRSTHPAFSLQRRLVRVEPAP